MDSTGAQDGQDPEQGVLPQDEPEPIQDIYVYIVREHDEPPDKHFVDTTLRDIAEQNTIPLRSNPLPPEEPLLREQKSLWPAYVAVSFYLILILSCLMLQLHFILQPITATVTLVPVEKTIATSASLHLVTGNATRTQLEGRELRPVTLTQTATTPATGIKHQNAANANGYLTFYNGQYTTLTVPADTIFTGRDGVLIQTDEIARIPPANPPYLGTATVSAHALNLGSNGNIAAYDINFPCCFTAVKVLNTSAFTGGQDEADFKMVTQKDIDTLSQTLEASITQSINAAIISQQKPNEAVVRIPCTPKVSPDHQAGDEAASVHIQVTETCTAIGYDKNNLQHTATQLLIQKAHRMLGSGYMLEGSVQVTGQKTEVNGTTVILVFTDQGMFVYQIPPQQEQRLKHLITGKPKQEAIQLLLSMPGIQQVSISGIEDVQNLPKRTDLIHVAIVSKN